MSEIRSPRCFALVDAGAHIKLAKVTPSSTIDHLPPRVYRIVVSEEEGVELQTVAQSFTLPEKIYGKTHAELVKTITDDFKKTTGTLGAMFLGTKGNGKSMAVEAICNKMLQQDIPTIIIDKPYPGVLIKDVLSAVGPAVLYFDEFAKIYPRETSSEDRRESQEQLLTLFSDSSLKKVLFLLTENDSSDVSNYIHNRPGRVKYVVHVYSPDFEVFKEMAEGLPIHQEVMDYVEFYLNYHRGTQFGIDALLALRDAAVNAAKPIDFVGRIKFLNVPMAVFKLYNAELVTHKESDLPVPYQALVSEDKKTISIKIIEPEGGIVEASLGFDDLFELPESDEEILYADKVSPCYQHKRYAAIVLNGKYQVTVCQRVDDCRNTAYDPTGEWRRAFMNTAGVKSHIATTAAKQKSSEDSGSTELFGTTVLPGSPISPSSPSDYPRLLSAGTGPRDPDIHLNADGVRVTSLATGKARMIRGHGSK